ncbi:hypothetical protein HGRIS_007411 [Hohenbuehelia grisea]|uniref:Uncharacterized protein n=1 Tax=Hohenbuehelia grisea TaxID=104357 RepID=A0ABR3J651_9AGAR
MARATRSTVQNLEKESSTTTTTTQAVAPDSPSRAKAGTKKRKRTSHPDGNEPAAKQPRSDIAPLKDEEADGQGSNPDQEASHTTAQAPASSVGDIHMDAENSRKILEVLEMIDTQGLLDRVFPLQSDPSTSNQGSYSLRTLLQEATRRTFRTLHSAVQNLRPISSHPRSRPSKPAVSQQRFCDTAISLIDQASRHALDIPLSSILSSLSDGSEAETNSVEGVEAGRASPARSTQSPPPPPKRRYALVQRLPGGDWWSSLNSEQVQSHADIKNLSTGHAELVAILPTPSVPATVATTSALLSKSTASTSVVPTLGSYSQRKAPTGKTKLPEHRRVTCGAFLDYGPYASFAPTFSQEGAEIGREQLGEVLYRRHLRRKAQQEEMRIRAEGSGSLAEVTDDPAQNDVDADIVHVGTSKVVPDVDETFEGLLPAEDIAAIKSTITSLEEEKAIHELLTRNQWALTRLEELQRERLSMEGGGKSIVKEGSDEWEIAQAIMESLTVLASLRPRSSKDAVEESPLVPPPSVLRQLQRTLPAATLPGWFGTLPPTKPTALRDNSTVRMRSGAAATVSTAPATVAPVAAATPAASTTYPGYTYSSYAVPQQQQQQQYRGTTAQPTTYAYKPTQSATTTSYFQSTYPAAQPGQMAQQQSYYGAQAYGVGATGQQPYAYTSWYNYAGQPAAAGSTSGRGTPQPVVATPATMQTSYGSYLTPVAQTASGSATPTGVRPAAVANTVAKPQGAWPAGTTYPQGVTLPTHLRTGAQTAPATPVQANGLHQVATTPVAR